METFKIESLLNQVSIVKQKYEEIETLTGSSFNVFDILGLSTREVRTHSAFISELLNTKGSHKQKDIFLKLFIQIINEKISNTEMSIPLIDTVKSITTSEYFIGFKDDETGGYIDILISEGKNNIIIENKINAGDQEKQLIRYHNFGKENSFLIYLTLNGKEATNFSTNEKLIANTDYLPISYEVDILNWLELCKKQAVEFPIIRESIIQYIHLIKKLTNKTMTNQENQELVNILLKDINSSKLIMNLQNELDIAIIKNMIPFIEKISKEKNLILKYEGAFGEVNSNFSFSKTDWKCSICYYFRSKNDLILGIDSKNIKDNSELKIAFKKILDPLNLGKKLDYPDWLWLCESKWNNKSWEERHNSAYEYLEYELTNILCKINLDESIMK